MKLKFRTKKYDQCHSFITNDELNLKFIQLQENLESGDKVVRLRLELDPTFTDQSKLRCISQQLFPNGSIIFESAVGATLAVVVGNGYSISLNISLGSFLFFGLFNW